MREAKKQWKRLPFADDENPEFQAIINEVWVENFMKTLPGHRYIDSSDFWSRGNYIYYWFAFSSDWHNAYNMVFCKYC